MIAIGGGGYVPARILRYAVSYQPHNVHTDKKEQEEHKVGKTKENLLLPRSFLKAPGKPNIPIQAIGLSLYEQLGTAGDSEVETPGTKVTRTQWLDLSSLEMANLIGKNVLIVDEVDDTRTTLEYAVRELEKDVEDAMTKLGREGEKTNFSIFVLHNKDKTKKGVLPQEILHGRYIAARTVGDVWINYPWEAMYVHFYYHLYKE